MADTSATKTLAPSRRANPPETPAVPNALPEQAAVEAAPPAATPGWFRNTAATELTVIPHLYPSARLAPGEAAWLPDDPRHPNLERCEPPGLEFLATDTAGSEK